MHYESPIAVYQTQQEMIQCISEKQDELVFAKVRQVVDVNKSELIKALQYDRDQYKKGYEDGLKDAVPVDRLKDLCERWVDACTMCVHMECDKCALRTCVRDLRDLVEWKELSEKARKEGEQNNR